MEEALEFSRLGRFSKGLAPAGSLCHDFHIFTSLFLLSSKCPNTRSNHDMALSYLILSFLIFSSFFFTLQVTQIKTREKQIVLRYKDRGLSTRRLEQRPTRSPCWNSHPHPPQHLPHIHHEARNDQTPTNQGTHPRQSGWWSIRRSPYQEEN